MQMTATMTTDIDLRGTAKGETRRWAFDRLAYARPGAKRRIRQQVETLYCAEGWHSRSGTRADPRGAGRCCTLLDAKWRHPSGGFDRDRFLAFHDEHPVVWVVKVSSKSESRRLEYCDAHLPDEYRPLGGGPLDLNGREQSATSADVSD
jgi:hypothetical protein